MNWRERWYAERNLPYEPPPLVAVPPFQCVGNTKPAIPKREREPADEVRRTTPPLQTP